MMKEVENIIKHARRGIYLGPDVISQRKEYELNRRNYIKKGIGITPVFVKTMTEWEQGFLQGQTGDFLIVGNNGGINDWDSERAERFIKENTKILTVTNYDWMIPYVMLAMTKIAEEQGEWAASVALSILDGEKISNIPIVVNRRWNIFINQHLLEKVDINLPSHIIHKAIKYGG